MIPRRLNFRQNSRQLMYDLPYYKENDEQVIRTFVEQHPFAFLTGCDPHGMPVATQVPSVHGAAGRSPVPEAVIS